jgi:hypothetical protein
MGNSDSWNILNAYDGSGQTMPPGVPANAGLWNLLNAFDGSGQTTPPQPLLPFAPVDYRSPAFRLAGNNLLQLIPVPATQPQPMGATDLGSTPPMQNPVVAQMGNFAPPVSSQGGPASYATPAFASTTVQPNVVPPTLSDSDVQSLTDAMNRLSLSGPPPPNVRPKIGDLITTTAPDFQNPGAVFDDADGAAQHVFTQTNPTSMKKRMEYGWLVYRDKDTGKFGYTTPQAMGHDGTDTMHLNRPPGVIAGMGHTHGAYESPLLTNNEDQGNPDVFSGRDRDFMREKTHGDAPENWTFYLGTPSGNLRKWNPGGNEKIIFGPGM